MIRVNLNPAGKPGRARGPGISLPKISGLPTDRWVLTALAVVLVAVVAMGYLFTSIGAREEEAEVDLQAELQDSTRYANLIARSNALFARRDSILQRVAVIQEIDSERYIWPHLLDEVSTALPDYTWLTQIQQLAFGGEDVRIALRGRAGNNFALAQFMQNLEGSPFLRNVGVHRTGAALPTHTRRGWG